MSDSPTHGGRRIRGCLLAGAYGDALGAGPEFLSITQIRKLYGRDGITELTPSDGVIGSWTDDTQMTLFTAEALIRTRRARVAGDPDADPVTELRVAYDEWYATQVGELGDPPVGSLVLDDRLWQRRAPGNTCLTALSALRDRRPVTNYSKGCGGVMRAAPAGLWPGDDAAVFELGANAAWITHHHPSGYLAAGALAVIIRRLVDGAPLLDAVHSAMTELREHDGHAETTTALTRAIALGTGTGAVTPELLADRLGGGWVAEEALAIAVCCALRAHSLRHGVLLAVNHSGDSDSTGAICGNILGALFGASALPAEVGKLVCRDVLETMADRLVATFG